ncbi:Ig-like domain-containing protein [Dongia sp.]|uniref:Ig-like domain-containing protein n=1 Tax=Dongia sp. TaxID=1977262 RepID=UPI0035B28729
MATDTTQISIESNAAGTVVRESDIEQGHLTQSGGAPVAVQIPQGENIVRVQVTPGEIIQLPFPADGLVARLGDNGNLAVRVGDVTVILIGYADAAGQGEVAIIGSDGNPIDIAAVLAATDPNLDIQTAAGPAAGDAGTGVDNNGGLFTPFDPADGLGGLNAVGGLDPTALNYNLIQRDFVEFIEEEPTETDPVPVVIETIGGIVNEDDLTGNYGNVLDGGSFNDSLAAIDAPQALVQDIISQFCWNPVNGNDRFDDADYDDEDTRSGTPFGDAIVGYDPNGGDTAPYDFDREPLVFNGTATVDFGADAPGTLVFNAETLTQLAALGLKSGGFDLQYQQIDDTHIQGYIFDGECYILVFTVAIGDSYPNPTGPGTTFDIYFILSDNLDHPLPVGVDADETNLLVPVFFQAIDNSGSTAGGQITFGVRDDIPVLENENLDRSSGLLHPALYLDDDDLPGGNAAGIGDDASSSTFDLSGYLGVHYGADGPGSLLLSEPSLPEGFTSSLSPDGLTLLIKQNGVDVLKVSLSDSTSGHLTVEQLAAIDHPAGEDENNLQFTINFEATDFDGDKVGGSIEIDVDDDTPVVGWNCTVRLDDDVLGAGNPSGIGDDVDSLHATGILAHGYGADGAGTLLLTGATLPAGFTQVVSPDGLTLTISQNGMPVLQVTLSNNTDGSYTVTQLAPIEHGPGSDENNVQFAIDYEVTDGDGDPVSGSLTIDVDDDTPTVSANNLVQLDDDALPFGNAGGVGDDDNSVNATGFLAHNYGADGAGTTLLTAATLPAGFTQLVSPDGLTLTISQNGTPVLLVVLSNATDGSYTVTQLAPISHAAGLDENNIQFTVNYQVTDKDGDTANGSIIVDVDDDTPTVSANNLVQLDDDALPSGNAGGTGDDDDSVNATGFLAHNYGADGAGTLLLTGATLPAGFTQVVSPDGLTLTISQNGTPVLLVTLSNTSDGSYTVTQLAPISHATGLDENNLQFLINYQVTDKDGDTANGSMIVDIDDDTPTVSTNNLVQLDDDALPFGNAGGTGDDDNSVNAMGFLAHNYGADGAGSIAFLTTGAPMGFTYLPAGPGLLVLQGVTPVMLVTLIDPINGLYSVTQLAPISHLAGADENNIQLTFDYRVTDRDGDTVDGTLTVDVDDDTPTVSANNLVQLDDDSLPFGNAGGTGDDDNSVNATGFLAHNYGADGAGTTLLTAATLPAGFTQLVSPDGLTLTISQNGTPVLQVALTDATTGAYTVTQLAPISHPEGLDENNLQFTVNYQVTDKDDDTANGSMIVDIDDDTPTVSGNALVQLDDDALPFGNAGGVGDDDNSVNATGFLAHNYGADGAGTTLLTAATLPAGFTQIVSPDGLTLTISQNGTPVLQVVLSNATDGSYTVTQLAPISHAAGLDENNIQFTVNYQVTDKDGDTANGSMIVDVDDDTPTASNDNGGTVDTGATVSAATVLAGVAGNDSFGADGAKAGGGVVGVIAGNGGTQSNTGINSQIVTALGTLTLQANGTYTYTAKSNVSGTDYFTYTIEDADGDRTTAILSFDVADQAQGTISGSAIVYEDGMPNQNTGNLTTQSSALGVSFTPADNEVVTSLTLKNLPAGWQIFDGNTLLGTGNGSDFMIDTTLHTLANLKILPPVDNADADLTLQISATIQDPNGGLTSTVNGQLAITRDAVADKPTAVSVTVTDAGANGLFSVGEAGTVNIKATFGDAADASETHTLVFKTPAGFNLSDWNSGTQIWSGVLPAGVTVISVTGSAAAGWTVTFGVADNTTSVDLNVSITNTAPVAAGAQFTVDAKSLDEATVAGPNGNGSGAETTDANNTAITSASTPVVSARILNGELVTNTPSQQQGDQAMILTFVLDGNPLNAYSQVVVRDTQGQQGAVLADSGFNIDPSKDFNVALENPLEGHKIIVTDFNLEGVTLDVSGGNIQIEHEDSSGKPMAVYAQMSPNDGGTVIVDESNDGGSGNDTKNGTGGQDYLFGGSGNDTLNGGAEDDVLNGGIGNDTLNGDAGNDVLVWNGGLQTDAVINPASGDHYHGGDGFDLLRIDQGALYNSTVGNKSSIDYFPDLAADATVDLRGAHVDGIEGILLTEEAVISGSTQSGSDALGTRILLNASDVLGFSETDTLYVIGSKGDTVDIDNLTGTNTGGASWVAGGDVTPIVGGVTFTQYTGTFSDANGSHTVTLFVDKDVTVV